MFKTTYYHLGKYEICSIKNEKGIGIEFIPSVGGSINQLYLGDQATPIFDSFNESDIENNKWYKQSLLFPFPNRLADGKYSHKNKEFFFPVNEIVRNNALHGFLYKQALEIDQIECIVDQIKITLTYLNEKNFEYYPFSFRIKVKYLVTKSEFQLDFEIENIGDEILPYGFGWHPYFKFKNTVKLSIPLSEMLLIDDRGLPTGNSKQYSKYKDYLVVEDQFDSCFRVVDEIPWTIRIGNDSNNYCKLIADDSMKYIQLFNPEQNRIAVEPMTCNINALNNHQGLLALQPGSKKMHSFKIIFFNET